MTTITVSAGDTATVATHIAGTNYVVDFGGTLEVSSGGIISGSVTVDGELIVNSGGVVSHSIVTEQDAYELVLSGGTTSNAIVSSGGTEFVGFAFGAGGGTSIQGVVSGTENVLSRGTSLEEQVTSGGTQNVFASGTSFMPTSYQALIRSYIPAGRRNME